MGNVFLTFVSHWIVFSLWCVLGKDCVTFQKFPNFVDEFMVSLANPIANCSQCSLMVLYSFKHTSSR